MSGDALVCIKVAPSYYQGQFETDPEPDIERAKEICKDAWFQHKPLEHKVKELERTSGVRVLFFTDCDGHTYLWTGEEWVGR